MSSDVVARAESIVKRLETNKRGSLNLTTSQIRKFLASVNALKNRVDVWKSRVLREGGEPKELPAEIANEIKFMKVKLIYQSGRERAVRNFIDTSKIIESIEQIGRDPRKFEEFSRLVEAIVAYHKFYGGRD